MENLILKSTDISDGGGNTDTNSNVQYQNIEPIRLIDEGTTEFYIGTSTNGSDIYRATWQIKKILKTGNVWAVTLFPDGDQEFKYIWDDRASYTFI